MVATDEFDVERCSQRLDSRLVRAGGGRHLLGASCPGRPHPDIDQRFRTGHSIGTLEDNVLIVDTRNFEDHRSPYQTGVPSGAQKHVVERYELSEDGTHILLECMLDDPEYFVAPMTHST